MYVFQLVELNDIVDGHPASLTWKILYSSFIASLLHGDH
jgi:hypothetical protein